MDKNKDQWNRKQIIEMICKNKGQIFGNINHVNKHQVRKENEEWHKTKGERGYN